MAESSCPETTIVIRSFNEERWLPEVFQSLKDQSYQNFEVVLVDSGSVDRSREIAQSFGARIVRLRSEDFTFGHSLNLGCQVATGKFVAILSAHAIPANIHWLNSLIDPLRDPETAMVFGSQRGHELSKFPEFVDFERTFPFSPMVVDEDHPFANNANSAVKKICWEQYEFDEGLPGLEDIDWAKHWIERGMKVSYQPDATVIHVHTESWEQVRRRYYREAMAARWVGTRLLRHIPIEVFREFVWCLQDLWRAPTFRQNRNLVVEILRFRYEKMMGTVGGIIDSRGLSNPARRSEMYFRKGFPAVVIRGPNRAKIEERAVPSLKPGELLVRVAYVGICGTDLEILEGSLGYYRSGLAKYPIVPGHEFSGTVVAFGPRVTDMEEGDRVVVECIQGCGECEACASDSAIQCSDRREVGVFGQDGGYAAYVITRSRYVHRIPDNLGLDAAALTEPVAVVLKGLRRLGSSKSDSHRRNCAVVGAGTIGQIAAQVLTIRGHSVTVFDRNGKRLENLRSFAETSDVMDELRGFDWIIEATGNQEVLTQVLSRADTGASVLLLGLPYAESAFSFESVVASDQTIVGSVGSSGQDFSEAIETLPKIDTSVFLNESYPLERFETAWKRAREGSSVKIMLHIDESATNIASSPESEKVAAHIQPGSSAIA
ncbi:MAG: alcohol dehydrogenase catalytic domain-containing protein [Pseudomonadales bacterium]